MENRKKARKNTSNKERKKKKMRNKMKLKELFETKKQYIIEVDLDKNNYLFIEGLSEFGGTISKRFNIKNIKTFCIELIDKKDGYINTIDSINVSLESDIQQIKEMGLNQIEMEANEKLGEKTVSYYEQDGVLIPFIEDFK